MNYLSQLKKAKESSSSLRVASNESKNIFLKNLSKFLLENQNEILFENKKDLEVAKGLSRAMKKRLTLDEKIISAMAEGVEKISEFNDPVGIIEEERTMPSGLIIRRSRAPIGVILFVYESRPNVIVDAAALCVKSGNALITRGGKEAMRSNTILLKYIKEALESAGLPKESVQQLEDRNYETLNQVVKENKYLDLIVPRGREQLIKSIKESAQVPVIAHERGLTHAYIDSEADPKKAIKICLNAKISNPSTCNSLEKILIHKKVYKKILPELLNAFFENKVEVRGCEKVCTLRKNCQKATNEDWDEEYLDLIIAVKVVDSDDEALKHISQHSSGLADLIISENQEKIKKFLKQVNSAAVLANASSRLVDGGQFGLGAELGISTSSIHMRGPMGLKDLTVARYLVFGNGQIRK
jgi:glutamate-5-semialdehyde dehydrogenase